MERTAMALSATTIGRLVIASMLMMAAWPRLMIGIERTEPKAPVLSSVKVPPWTSSSWSLLLRVLLAELAHRLREAGDAEAVGVADDGHEQPAVGGDGDPEVDALPQDDLVLAPRSVEVRVLEKRLRDGVRHERQVGEVDAVALAERLLLRVAKGDEAGNIGLDDEPGVRAR